jgi:hypothetical protein
MRGRDEGSASLFSYVDIEARVAADHPLRQIRLIVNKTLSGLNRRFEALYAREERPSIPPERLLRASLLQMFYSIRSERQLMERLDFDLLFRWFVGLGVDDPVWDATVFPKKRDRLRSPSPDPVHKIASVRRWSGMPASDPNKSALTEHLPGILSRVETYVRY